MTISRTTLVVSFLLLATTTGVAQPRQGWPQRYAAGLKTSLRAPELRIHWLATGIGVALALPVDQSVKSYAVENGLMPEPMARFGDYWGGGLGVVVILPGIYLADQICGFSGPDTRQRLGFTFSSLLSVSIVTYVLKPSIGRERPNGRGNLSFPSGHTSFTFGIAEVIRTLYGQRAGALFYMIALNTGISRIHDNKHYLSDVIAGAGLGIGIVRGFDLAENRTKDGCAIRLLPAPGGAQVVLSF
jgi:hypothetical protein